MHPLHTFYLAALSLLLLFSIAHAPPGAASGSVLEVEPPFYDVVHDAPPQITSHLLRIANTSNVEVDFKITVRVQACDADDSAPWLSVSPAAGSIPSGRADLVLARLDSTDLPDGDYSGVICVSDETHPSSVPVPVFVTLKVNAPPPTITPTAPPATVTATTVPTVTPTAPPVTVTPTPPADELLYLPVVRSR